MAQHSSIHFYFDWAKERLDEMDATIASLETHADRVHATDAKAAREFRAELRERRDAFKDAFDKQDKTSESAWVRAKGQLERAWADFEGSVTTYIGRFDKTIEEGRETFRNAAAAQLKAWREAADRLHVAGAALAADSRADVEAAVQRMKAEASKEEARLMQFSADSWAAFSSALDQSRAVFERAIRDSSEALKRASP